MVEYLSTSFTLDPSIYVDKKFEGGGSNQHQQKLITDIASLFHAILNILAEVIHIFKQTVLPCMSLASAPACGVADTGADQYRTDVVTVSAPFLTREPLITGVPVTDPSPTSFCSHLNLLYFRSVIEMIPCLN